MRLSSTGILASRLLLSGLVSALLLSGCMVGKKPVGTYAGRPQTAAHGPGQQAGHPARSTGAASDQATYARDVLMPALIRINDRISAYEQKVKSWQDLTGRTASLNLASGQVEQLSGCRQQAADLLAGYKRLHDQLLRDQSVDKSRRLVSGSFFDLDKKDFAYLEGNCTQLLTGFGFSPSSAGSMTAGMQSLEIAMAAALTSGDYEQVISDFQLLPLSPGEQPSYAVSYSYGVALMKSGREQEARQVFKELLTRIREQDQGQWEFKLLQLLGDLDFALRDYTTARSRYEELERVYGQLGSANDWARQQLSVLESADFQSEEVRAYAALLLGYLAYTPQRDGFTIVQQAQAFQQRYPASVVGSSAAELGRKANEDAEKWFSGLLERVDLLSKEQRNQEALLLIESVPGDILPLDKQAILKLKKNALAVFAPPIRTWSTDTIQEEILETTASAPPAVAADTAQVAGPDTVPDGFVPVTALQENWDQGMANMQAKEYDKAIEIFSDLLNTSYGTEAKIQIEEASRLAAQDDRKKAAELFVRANRTSDPEARKQLLLSSRALLEEILRKYPQSGLEDKVKRNISRIDQELAGIEQTLAPSPVEGAGDTQAVPASNTGAKKF